MGLCIHVGVAVREVRRISGNGIVGCGSGSGGGRLGGLALRAELEEALLQALVLHLELEERVQPASTARVSKHASNRTARAPAGHDRPLTLRCCGWGTASRRRRSTGTRPRRRRGARGR